MVIATMPRSLLDLPNEILLEIIFHTDQHLPACEPPTDHIIPALFHVNHQLRLLSFQSLGLDQVILHIRIFRTKRDMKAVNDLSTWIILDPKVTDHFISVPSFWKSISPQDLDIIRVDVWKSEYRRMDLIDVQEEIFICNTPGLANLLREYNDTATVLNLCMCYTFPARSKPRTKLYAELFAICEAESLPLKAFPTEVNKLVQKTFPNYGLMLSPLPEKVVGRNLAPTWKWSWHKATSRYHRQFLHLLEVADLCMRHGDITSARQIFFYFGGYIVRRKPSNNVLSYGLRYLDLVAWLSQPGWRGDMELSKYLEMNYLASQVWFLSTLAWCTSIELSLRSNTRLDQIRHGLRWEYNHNSLRRFTHPEYRTLGLCFADEGDFSYMDILSSCYNIACQFDPVKHEIHDHEKVQLRLEALCDAYSRSSRHPVYLVANERIQDLLAHSHPSLSNDVPSATPSHFSDIDGIPRTWTWPRTDVRETNTQTICADDDIVPYMFRAQELAYRAKSFGELKEALLQEYHRVLNLNAPIYYDCNTTSSPTLLPDLMPSTLETCSMSDQSIERAGNAESRGNELQDSGLSILEWD